MEVELSEQEAAIVLHTRFRYPFMLGARRGRCPFDRTPAVPGQRVPGCVCGVALGGIAIDNVGGMC
jgi:hypothetical protein